MKLSLARSALAIMAGAMAIAVAPIPPIAPSAWAEKNLYLPDGPDAGELWARDKALHVVEIVDALAPESPVNEVVVMKSAQTAFTTAGLIFVGHSIDRDPCRIMAVQPTTGALSDFNRGKLQPVIDASPSLSLKVYPQSSRSGDGSTATSKQYAGGSLTLAIASSAADLRSKTIKKAFLDEIDEYPDDLAGQGDPIDMVEARQISFLTSGEWKRFKISTPRIKGASKIETAYLAGDQRRWHVKCPGCGDRFVFEFDLKHFRFNDSYPYQAHYAAPCCGTIVDGNQKNTVYRTGEWIATAEKPGAIRSYHFDAMSSPLVPWDEIARKYIDAEGDPLKLKTFWNLYLGLPYEVKGNAPDHVRLMERREDLERRHIPPLGLILVGSADVQLHGIYYEIKAYGPNRQKYIVDADFIQGDTSDPHAGAFLALSEVYERTYPDAFGGARRVDAFGIDSGYRSHIVYTWVRGRHGAFALKGLDGWSRPALGNASPVDIDFNGKRTRAGAYVWGVGTWSLKGAHYADLGKVGVASGQEQDPPGYTHFGRWLDEVYFRQITSEYIASENFRGRVRRVWKVRNGEENHFLDCTVYNDALADYIGLSRLTGEEWAQLASERCAPEIVKNPDMFSAAPLAVQKPAAPKAAGTTDRMAANDGAGDNPSIWDDY